MKVRAATAADLAFVSGCARAAYARYVPLIGREPAPMTADFAGHAARDELFVAEDGAPVGYVVVHPDGDALQIENVAVLPQATGRGYGRALMAWAEARALGLGLGAVTLYTNARMTGNLDWYPALGYRAVRRAVEDGFDRVFFRKDL